MVRAGQADQSEAMKNSTMSKRLTAEQERDMARTIEVGVLAREALSQNPVGDDAELLGELAEAGAAAWREFVLCNLGLVHWAANREPGRHQVEHDELVQEGILGLMHALMRFDYQRGVRFSTFALPWIQQYLAQAAAGRMGAMGLSANRARKLRVVRAMASTQIARSGTYDPDDIAARTDLTPHSVQELMTYQQPAHLGEFDVPSQPPSAALDYGLREEVDRLPPVQRMIVLRRYGFVGEPATAAAVASELGLSTSTVLRHENRALKTLTRRLRQDMAA